MTTPSFSKRELFDTLKSLLSFASVNDTSDANHPYGKACTEALLYLLEDAKKYGFRTVNYDNKVGYIEYGDHAEHIAVLCHLDVVPAGDGWQYPPFKGTETDDCIIGRGALDDKGPAAACYTGLKAIKSANIALSKNIRLIFGLNEETGSQGIAHYLKKENPPATGFTPDADFPVIFAEKGITSFKITKDFNENGHGTGVFVKTITGGTALNMVPDTCEALLEGVLNLEKEAVVFENTYSCKVFIKEENGNTKVKVKGASAHASTPEKGLNAISLMMQFLSRLELVKADVSDFIRAYAKCIAMQTNGENLGMALADAKSGELTLNVGIINCDTNGGEVLINIRYPVSYQPEDVYNTHFKARLKESSLTFSGQRSVAPVINDIDDPLIQTLLAIYQKHTGDGKSSPIAIGGGTYARSMPNIVAYGPLFKHSKDTMHQANEFITKSDLVKITEIYTEAMLALAK